MERTAARQHILVLEDDSSISELLIWILTDAGYDVTCAGSLRDARRACAERTPDVLIADLLLPDGLGSDLVDELTTDLSTESPRSIMMSAVPQARRHAEAAGANFCLTKPFDLADLLDAVSGPNNSDCRELQPS